MSGVQEFCLRWHNHQHNFIAVFTHLLSTESLVDVTLAAEGMHLQAHKVVLSACSVYFHSLFMANPTRHPIVILKDIKYADLKILVNFMYYGEVNVSQEQLPQILEGARMLKIKGLTEIPETSVSMTNLATERQNLMTPGESSCYSENQRHSISPCNLSPSMRRKRVRKPSIDSTSAQTISNEGTNIENSRPDSNMIMNPINGPPRFTNRITDTQMLLDYTTSKDSFDENGALNTNINMNVEENPSESDIIHVVPKIQMENTNANVTQPGPQWALMEHGYPRFAPTPCQGNNIHPMSAINMTPMHSQEQALHSFGMQGMMSQFDYQQAQAQMHAAQTQALAQEGIGLDSPGPSAPGLAPHALMDPQQPQKRRRVTNPQQEENFQRALEAVRFGGIGFCKAARMFGVNNRTLWLEYKKKGYPNNRPSIRNRIKQEHSSPPPEVNEEVPHPPEPHLLVCAQHNSNMVGFIDPRHIDFPPAMQLAAGMQIPPGMQIPSGMQIPPGIQIPPVMQNINRNRPADERLNLHPNPPTSLHF